MTGKCTAEISHNSVLFVVSATAEVLKVRGFPLTITDLDFDFGTSRDKKGTLFGPFKEPTCRIFLNRPILLNSKVLLIKAASSLVSVGLVCVIITRREFRHRVILF